MSLTNVFGIAGSGMSAQTIRLNTTASNMANAESVSSSLEDTYRARKPVFSLRAPELEQIRDNTDGLQPGQGVDVLGIVESDAELKLEYNPDHPMADDKGYVYYPNVNVVEEMADMISASRSFQINAEMMDTAKTLLQRTLQLGQ